ncbi:hypothetical protein FM113_05930 [Leucobacter sp. 7(1)]|uniref:DUF7927 domain-containing protein n=1 Tax=Leucobacter sp. 7(1) TaxID=1255613 RepID=UPI00097EFB33|nr:choice-of-anchor A family protein [Leucobacter sp. 7(1)]SJN09353.1 hypothetical protein FM113_05930 [Leucobacter sp. 7(1)]
MQNRSTLRRALRTPRRRLASMCVAAAVLAGAIMPLTVLTPAFAEDVAAEVAPEPGPAVPEDRADEAIAPEHSGDAESVVPAEEPVDAADSDALPAAPTNPDAPAAETPADQAAAAPLAAAPFAAAPVCVPNSGVGTVHPANPSKPMPADGNASVYVGGNYTRTAGAELEGQLVVRGNATFAPGSKYNIGWVGAGSGLIPAEGGTALRVGGNVSIGSGAELITGTVDAATGAPKPVHVRVGGAVSGSGSIALQHTGSTTQTALGRDAALGRPAFSNWADGGHAALRQSVERNQNTGVQGTVTTEAGGYLTLTGAPGATRHQFVIDASLLSLQGTQGWALNLGANIAPNHPIVITVTGASPTVNISGVWANKQQLSMGDVRFGQAASQILWTFPAATKVTVAGAQFPGSVIVPTPGSATTVTAAGANGRYWVAGDLTHNGAGSEFHAFPFIGDPETGCENPVDPEPPVVVEPEAPATCDANTFYALDQGQGTNIKLHRYTVNNGTNRITRHDADVLLGQSSLLQGWNTNALGMSSPDDFMFTGQKSKDSEVRVFRATQVQNGKLNVSRVGTKKLTIDSGKTVVAGAVEPKSGDFYFGYYSVATGQKQATLHVYRTPGSGTTETTKLLTATIETSVAMTDYWGNGDFAFDTNGNLHFVLSSSTKGASGWQPAVPGQAVVGSLTAKQLETGKSVRVSSSTPQRNPLNETGGFNGLAYLGSGKMVAEQGSSQTIAEPGTLKPIGTPQQNSDFALVDLASCASPPTLTLQKNVIDRVENADQFQLELLRGGTVLNEALTAGTKAGIQAEKIENVPVEAGAKYRIRESFPAADSAKMYQSALVCVQDPAGSKKPLTVTPAQNHEWDVTIPTSAGASGAEVLCTITNDPLHPNLAITKTANPASGTAVQAGQQVTYTVTFENTGRGEARVKHVDHLADVLDDATLDVKSLRYGDGARVTGQTAPLSPVGITGKLTPENSQLAITGAVPPGAKRTISYTVTVLAADANTKSRQAQANDGEPHGYLLRNFVTPAGKTPPAECAPKPGENVLCTEHPIPAWDIVKSAQPPNDASLHTGGNVYYTVAIRNFSGSPLAGVHLSDDITEVMRVATWAPEAPRVVPKVQGVRFLNAAGEQVDQDGNVMPLAGRPGFAGQDGPDSLPYEVVTTPVHQNPSGRVATEDPRRGSWTLDTEAFDIPQGVVRAEVSYAVQVGYPADPVDPTQPWQRDGAKVPAAPMALFDNFVAGTSTSLPPLSCELGTDVTQDERCQTRHQLGDGYFHIQKNSTAADPNKPGSVQWNLQGVEFEIRDTPNGGPTQAICDVAQNAECAEFFKHTDASDGQAAGSWHASNLPEGDYYLVETKAAEGHQLLAEPIRFHVGPVPAGQPLGQGQLGIYQPGIPADRSFNGAAGDRVDDFFLPRCDAPTKLPSGGGPACVMPTGWLMQVYDPKLLPLPMAGGVPPLTLLAGGALLALGAGLWIRRSLRTRAAA